MDSTTMTVRIVGKDEMTQATSSASSGFKGLWKSVAGGALVAQGVTMAYEKLSQGFDEVKQAANDWQSQQSALNAALKSTGDASGLSSDEAIKYAESISKATPVTRDATLAGENMLLTFTNIHKNVFPQTTQAMVDMATAMNHGVTPNASMLSTTAIQLGKALNDPATGLTKLQKVGVTFTAQQKDQIKTMQAAGNITGAQTVILDELSREFGGRASASAQTFQGRIQMLKNEMIDWGVNALQKAGDWANRVLVPALVGLLGQAKLLYEHLVTFLGPSFKALWNTIENQVYPSLIKLWHQVIEPMLPVIGALFAGALWLAVNAFNALLKIMTPVINFMLNNKGAVLGLATAFGVLYAAMKFNDAFNALTVGFNVFRLVTIPSTMASLSAFRALVASPMVMGAIGVGAALIALGAVYDAGMKTKQALDDLNNTIAANNKSDSAAEAQMVNLARHGTPAQQQRARHALAGLAAGRAVGGNVSSGTPYVVGEHGQELFIPSGNGTIIPANQTQQIMNSQSSSQHISVAHLSVNLANGMTLQEFFKSMNQDNMNVSRGLSPAQGSF